MADPYVVYTEEGDKQIKRGNYVYMVYKNASNVSKDLKFKHNTVNDYNQHLCGGWSLHEHTEFEEVDRVAAGLKPVGISMIRNLFRAEAKRKELSSKGLLATVYKRPDNKDLYFVTASPRGTVGKFFKNLNVLINDYRKHGLVYCADIIEEYKNVNFIKFHNLQYDDHHTCITGLCLGYPIENTIALIVRDDNDGDYFDFEEFNKEAIDEDHMNDDDCDCDECCERRYNCDNEEKECGCEDCHIYRYNAHIANCVNRSLKGLADRGKHENCDTCEYYEKYFEDLESPNDIVDDCARKQHPVIPYDEEQRLYRDFNDFIVYEICPGEIGVIGKYIKEYDSIIPLTAEEVIKARDIGLIISVSEDSVSDESVIEVSEPYETDIWALD